MPMAFPHPIGKDDGFLTRRTHISVKKVGKSRALQSGPTFLEVLEALGI